MLCDDIMLYTYKHMKTEVSPINQHLIWTTVQKYKGLFIKLAYEYQKNVDSLMDDTFFWALTNYNPERGNIDGYINKLAKDIARGNQVRDIPTEDEQLQRNRDEGSNGTAHIERDVVQLAIQDIGDLKDECYAKVAELALGNIQDFCNLVESLINNDREKKSFENEFFKTLTFKYQKRYPDFIEVCKEIYEEYKPDIDIFLAYDKTNRGEFIELDRTIIQKSDSKRIKFKPLSQKDEDEARELARIEEEKARAEGKLIIESDNIYMDPDKYSMRLANPVKNWSNKKHIYKVPYIHIVEYIIDEMCKDGTNPFRLTIGNKVIYRTLGGSVTLPVNNYDYSEIEDFVDVIKMELLTNILQDTQAKLIDIGSQCFYILYTESNETNAKLEEKKIIKGVPIKFQYIDETDKYIDVTKKAEHYIGVDIPYKITFKVETTKIQVLLADENMLLGAVTCSFRKSRTVYSYLGAVSSAVDLVGEVLLPMTKGVIESIIFEIDNKNIVDWFMNIKYPTQYVSDFKEIQERMQTIPMRFLFTTPFKTNNKKKRMAK